MFGDNAQKPRRGKKACQQAGESKICVGELITLKLEKTMCHNAAAEIVQDHTCSIRIYRRRVSAEGRKTDVDELRGKTL